jgi:hypothetical protein
MKKIKCADCKFAVVDKNASEYSQKHCKNCPDWENCSLCFGCKFTDNCRSKMNRKNKQTCDRRFENLCSKQTIKWTAFQCNCKNSEYYKSLLNVSNQGAMLDKISWSGCSEGVAK